MARSAGGLYGKGLSKNIMSAYAWLGAHFEPGDRVFLFGFSRGAFTVRSLSGFLAYCGLLDLRSLSAAQAFARVEVAYQKGYRDRSPAWKEDTWSLAAEPKVPIHFIGAWDTVGALGIPNDLALLNLLDRPQNWRFHDTSLGDHVEFARHAIAIDERRASFTPTLWTDPKTGVALGNDDRVQQLWFAGVHSDVGGGYYESELSDCALQWMFEEATKAGAAFQEAMVAQLRPNPQGPMHDSVTGAFRAMRTRPRNIPCFSELAWFHPSALERHNHPPISQAPYHATSTLAIGQSVSYPVYAGEHWNRSLQGLYLEKDGQYEFTAQGEWIDASIPSGPKGCNDGKFHPGEVAQLLGTFLGKVEGVYRGITGNDQADFWMTRRIESMPWFSLVGVIANDGPTGAQAAFDDGSPRPHQAFLIGDGPVRIVVKKPGYLYAFANDAWALYGNNHGSVTLRVECV